MDIPVGRWLEAIEVRRSRRSFDGEPVSADALAELERVAAEFRPWDDARVHVLREPAVDVFRGIVGSYGKITGAPSVLVFVVSAPGNGPAMRHLGYLGEAAVLEATALGLGTCWVTGFFNPRKAASLVDLQPAERVVGVSPVGHPLGSASQTERVMAGIAAAHNRKPLDEIAPGHAEWPEWARAAVSAARIAPSATNRQPWRFALEGNDLVLFRNTRYDMPRLSARLDVGIASLHVELGARAHGVSGEWRDAPQKGSGDEICRFCTSL